MEALNFDALNVMELGITLVIVPKHRCVAGRMVLEQLLHADIILDSETLSAVNRPSSLFVELRFHCF